MTELNLTGITSYPNRYVLMSALVKDINPDGLFCEFGVQNGDSINAIAQAIKPNIIHGFDSFYGLPEAWNNMPAEVFSREGQLPTVEDNVILYKGLFDVTLPEFAKAATKHIAFAHIDCDLYSSTKTIFGALAKLFIPGSIIQFDELHGYDKWLDHEYKALLEFGRPFEYIGYSLPGQQVAVRLI